MIVLRRKYYSTLDDQYRDDVINTVKNNERVRGNILKGSGAIVGGITGAITGGLASSNVAGTALGAIGGGFLGHHLAKKRAEKLKKANIKNAEKQVDFYNKLTPEEQKEVREQRANDIRAAQQEHLMRVNNRRLRHIRRNTALY